MAASRSILDIVLACQEEQPASEQDLRLTILSLYRMLVGVEESVRRLAETVLQRMPSAPARADFVRVDAARRFKAMRRAPAEYLGETFTPGTPSNLAWREAARQVAEIAAREAKGA